MTAQDILRKTEEILLKKRHMALEDANPNALNEALSEACMLVIAPKWVKTDMDRAPKKQACYLSAEYLVGRMVTNNLLAMGVLKDVQKLFAARGVDLSCLEEVEDMALGNGGLGRLAACFLDSAATHKIPLTGYGLYYRFGLFRQSFVNGRQTEAPDDWAKYADPWCIRRDEEAVVVSMKTGDVLAVPYDMPVIGYGMKSVSTLRLWQTEALQEIDFKLFNEQHYVRAVAEKNRAEDITKVLYPNDTLRSGKRMRIQQQYVLVSASLQDMLKKFEAVHGENYALLPLFRAVQLNDTHPAMAVPELIRLLGERGVKFEKALKIVRGVCSYTNHTVMQEALEKWDMDLLSEVVPVIARIIRKIDAFSKKELTSMGVKDMTGLAVIENEQAHMARLCVCGTHAVNGVAEIHSGLVKTRLFPEWHRLFPDRFHNVTNGVTQRRWLGLCNPELTDLIATKIGTGFMTDLPKLKKLEAHIDDLIDPFIAVKKEKKRQLAEFVLKREGIEIDPSFMFDVQVKRLHEYKRQLMNALSILDLYYALKDGSLTDFAPTVFLFGAKAAPGYVRAKSVIYFANCVAKLINSDPTVANKMRVVFVQNYNCSYAEKIIPAADLSEQISPAGTEASGTGNMKFMLNGAPTVGTFDGANIEIVEESGLENNYIFGATVDDIAGLENYDPKALYANDKRLARVIDALVDGTFEDPDGGLKELHDALLEGASWHKPDHYYVLLDFASYREARLKANRDYRDERLYARKALENIAHAGKFSSDRSVKEYAKNIWGL